VDHPLLVARQQVGQLGRSAQLGLEQRLADAGDVAVAEDPEAAGDQALLLAVALGVLAGQEADERLGHGQPGRGWGHACLRADVIGSLASISCPSQLERIQA
jgi:hypothetical protein